MTRIIRKPEVEKMVGLSGMTIDRREAAGQFPKRKRLGANSVGWVEAEITEWIEGLCTAKSGAA